MNKSAKVQQFLHNVCIYVRLASIVVLYNIEDAQQHALLVEKRVWRYGARKPLGGKFSDAVQKGLEPIRSTKNVLREPVEIFANSQPSGGGSHTFGRSDKGKAAVHYGGQNNFAPTALKGNSSSQSRYLWRKGS